MTIQASLKGYINGLSPITSLIGTRFYALRGPDAPGVKTDAPIQDYAIYRFSDIKPEITLGASPSAEGRLELEYYSTNYENAWAIEEAFRAALDGFPDGVMGGGVHVLSCTRTGAHDDDQPAVGLFKAVAEYTILWALT